MKDIQLPTFVANATSGKTFKLTDFKGKNLILYFYPKDSTPGCTREGEDFRDYHKEINRLNAVVIGISRDNLACHEKFKAKYEFPFELIADEDEKLCKHFDVIKMKNMYGKKVRGIERSTFLFDKNGKLKREWRKVTVDGHVKEILSCIEE